MRVRGQNEFWWRGVKIFLWGGGIKNGGGVIKKLNLTNQRPRNYLTQKTEDIRWTDRQTKNQLTGRLCSTSRSLQKYKKNVLIDVFVL